MYSSKETLFGKKILIIGHRGVGTSSLEKGNLPENTLPAFEKAFQEGADMVELDITLTGDSEIIVIHDDLLDRTTSGLGLIQNFTMESLKKLDAGRGTIWYGQNFRLSTLREIFDFFLKDNPIRALNIEIKTCPGPKKAFGLYMETIITKLLDLINEFAVSDRIIISSFDIKLLTHLRKINPGIYIALLAEGSKWTIKKMIRHAMELHFQGIHPHFPIIKSAQEVELAKKNKLFVQPWVLNTHNEFEKALAFGVTGIITDNPAALNTFLNK